MRYSYGGPNGGYDSSCSQRHRDVEKGPRKSELEVHADLEKRLISPAIREEIDENEMMN
jgi:hypothetical protein